MPFNWRRARRAHLKDRYGLYYRRLGAVSHLWHVAATVNLDLHQHGGLSCCQADSVST